MADNPSPASSPLERYLGLLLKPLARILIARGIPATAFYRLVKQAYVDAALDQMGAEVTDSRISVATGVHRRDVKALRSVAGSDTAATTPRGRKISMLATVLGKWMSNPAFTDENGPRPLPRTAGEVPGFDDLVYAVSRDVRPKTVLDELLSRGLVEVTDETVTLSGDGLVGTGDEAQQTHFFAHNVGDHLSAAADNLLGEAPAHLERAVFYNRLTPASVEKIEAEARALSLNALQEINALAAAYQSEDAEAETASHRIRFGVFFYKTDESAGDEGRSEDAED